MQQAFVLGAKLFRQFQTLLSYNTEYQLEIFAHNQASIRLFEKFGFQRWGYLPQIADLDDFLADVVILDTNAITGSSSEEEQAIKYFFIS